MTTITIPKPGEWPVDPQEDHSIEEDRIWIDGCFDFFHHGHAGVMLQARQLGTSLLVGIHSDEEILANKGPTVMSLAERVSASAACRWTTLIIPHAPYVTSLDWISHYGCKYVVHGDDITSDAGGEDCYRFVKEAGRFKVVKRTPGISTTDLVGRMLLCTKEHFIKSLGEVVVAGEGKEVEGVVMKDRLKAYASDESGLKPGVDVYMYSASHVPSGAEGASGEEEQTSTTTTTASSVRHRVDTFITGKQPRPDQRIVYVDGGFDLFSSGHIEFLKSVVNIEEAKAKKPGWTKDYSPCYVVAGIHDDQVINDAKGVNYPIMNIYERGLCLLQCRYIHSVVFGAPFSPSKSYLQSLPHGIPATIYHGPTTFMPTEDDPYADAKELGIFEQVPEHQFQNVNAGEIVQRILRQREMFVERQRRKGDKAVIEAEARKKELEMEKATGATA